MNRYEALRIAVEAHAGQRDKCGRDYVLHPLAVGRAVEAFGEDYVVAGLLHDVLEDTDFGLSEDDFWHTEWDALQALTKKGGESYGDYIERICCANKIAQVVKLADLWHNLQPERQACLLAKEQASLEKRYLKARDRIWEALGYEWWPESAGQSEEGTG